MCAVFLGVFRSVGAVSIDARRVDGRTELQLPECPAPPLQGWRVQARGAEASAASGTPAVAGIGRTSSPPRQLSQLRAESIEVLQRPWTPLADLRRDVAQRRNRPWGRVWAVSAALVLGSAQVAPENIRAAFRMAGLSHALAASGFHLSVLLGSVLMLARRWPPGLRLPLALRRCCCFSALQEPSHRWCAVDRLRWPC